MTVLYIFYILYHISAYIPHNGDVSLENQTALISNLIINKLYKNYVRILVAERSKA
jgi:hypothetical protein